MNKNIFICFLSIVSGLSIAEDSTEDWRCFAKVSSGVSFNAMVGPDPYLYSNENLSSNDLFKNVGSKEAYLIYELEISEDTLLKDEAKLELIHKSQNTLVYFAREGNGIQGGVETYYFYMDSKQMFTSELGDKIHGPHAGVRYYECIVET